MSSKIRKREYRKFTIFMIPQECFIVKSNHLSNRHY